MRRFLQEAKGYSLVDAGTMLATFPLLGIPGAILCGWFSDRYFGSRRSIPTLIYGLILIAAMLSLFATPPGHRLIDALAIGLYGFAVGGLVVFLAGLNALDICPKRATGARSRASSGCSATSVRPPRTSSPVL